MRGPRECNNTRPAAPGLRDAGMSILSRCPYCGSSRLAVDPERGTLLCQDCGSVLAELLIDDSHLPLDSGRRLPSRRRTRLLPPTLPPSSITVAQGGSGGGLECVERALTRGIEELATRRRHLVTALAYIVGGLSAGLPLSRSLVLARSRTGARVKTLYEIIRRYRSQLYEIVERVRRECREEVLTLLG